ncbi:MAG: TIGR00730 family Rossman fold protein [Phycisphaerales bacterium]|nr:TIGR00730 family Rossman fold protein [Phycisphaerales bacterium]
MTAQRIESVTVYCSSSTHVHADYLSAARQAGRLIAAAGRELVYGGGRVGLMGEVAVGARGAGGRVVGVITERLRTAEQLDPENHEIIVVATMRERKRIMEHRGRAFLVLPGGLGTMEEFFEILVGRLLGEHDKPIVLLNQPDPDDPGTGFFDPLLRMFDHMIGSRFVKPGVLGLFDVCRTPAEAGEALARHERDGPPPIDRESLIPSRPFNR